MRAFSPALLSAFLFATTVFAEGPVIPPQDPVSPESQGALPGNEIKICIDIDAIVRFEILAGAQRILRELYGGIGVRLRFVCEHTPDASTREIVVRLSDRTNPDVLKRALGFSLPYARDGVRVTIFYDRVEMLERDRDYTGIILGHVIAHELGHVLEAEDTHAENGIMRTRWDERDFQAMLLRELYFSESDVKAIHSHLPAFLQP